jgi:hypothetical protein
MKRNTVAGKLFPRMKTPALLCGGGLDPLDARELEQEALELDLERLGLLLDDRSSDFGARAVVRFWLRVRGASRAPVPDAT